MMIQSVLQMVYFILPTVVLIDVNLFVKDDVYKDMMCPLANLEYGLHKKATRCAAMCQRSTICKSFFYNNLDMHCKGTEEILSDVVDCYSLLGTEYYRNIDVMTNTSAITTLSTTSITPSSTTSSNTNTESQYGNACSSNSECTINYSICLGGVCTCEAGYRYETATGMCVETCSEYGTTFIEYVGFGLYTADLTSDGALSITISECMDLCTTTTDVLCLGFNYAYSRCKLKSGSPLTHSSSYDANSAFSYFSRNCL